MIKYVAGIAILLAFGSGWYFSSLVAEREKENALRALEASLTEKYQQQKQMTEAVSNDYQQQLSALNKRVRALRVRHSCDNLSTTTKTSGRDAKDGAVVSGTYAFEASELIDFAELAEQTRLKHNACVDFVNKLY